MSSFSRRALLGYTGTATAGTALFTGGTARAAASEPRAETEAENRNSQSAAPDLPEANELAASRGWPPVTFYGTPAPAPLN